MSGEWDLGPIADLPEGEVCLRRGPNDERIACVRRADGEVDVVDDTCPHEGYPLSEGEVSGRSIACRWHGGRFDLGSGACTSGGEPVRRYPTRVLGGRLLVDPAVDRAAEEARIRASLRRGLAEGNVGRCTRDALSLVQIDAESGPAAAFETILREALVRDRGGLGHPAACAIDTWTWVARGWVAFEPAAAAAATLVGEPLQFLPERARAARIETAWEDAPKIEEALAARLGEMAEGRTRDLALSDASRAIGVGLVPFVRKGIHDYGHGAIYAGKALEIAAAFPALGEEAAAALATMLSRASSETSLASWSATREAIARSAMIDRVGTTLLDGPARAAFETQVLAGEREAVGAALESIARGAEVSSVLRAIGHAAAVRMSRFDLGWTRRDDAEVGFLDLTHAVTQARAVQELWARDPRAENASLAVVAASLVGKLRKADDPTAPPPDPFVGDARAERVVDAVRAREPARARAMVARIDRATRIEVYRGLAPFAAFEAHVRPILLAHAIKTTEALYRMELDDPRPGSSYLDALARYLATPTPERRFERTARIARRFLAKGRPPGGLF